MIQEALAEAISLLSADLETAGRPDDAALTLDHDTRGLGGSPDIAATILQKIEAASVFVADVTPIALSSPDKGKRAKHIANPNVLIELGYAKRALGPEKIIQVWNTAFTDCTPEDLPFDMKGRRGPISFRLQEGASTEELRIVRSKLTKDLKAAIETIVRPLSRPAAVAPAWQPTRDGDPSVWFREGHQFLVNEPDHGSGTKRVSEGPRSYVRLLPAGWNGSDDADRHDILMGNFGGFSWGYSKGGMLTYPGSILFPDLEEVKALTMRFEGTGELWAIRTDISGTFQDLPHIRGDEVPAGWTDFLRDAIPWIANGGGSPPFRIRVGVATIQGMHWPTDNRRGRPHVSLEDGFEHEFTVQSADTGELLDPLTDAWTGFRRIFSEPPVDAGEVKRRLRLPG